MRSVIVFTCILVVAAASAQQFTDIVTTAGTTGYGYTTAWNDYDRDGYIDLYLTDNNGGDNRLYRNNSGSGTFTEIGLAAGANAKGGAANWVDYDNDGYADLSLASQAFRLLHNSGSGTFSDATSGSGIDVGGPSASWGDYDGDGDLDLYLVGGGDGRQSRLYRNEGTGRFTDITGLAGVSNDRLGQPAAWGDYDGDGDADLFVPNYLDGQTDAPSRLYRNEGDGTFTDVAGSAGVAVGGTPRGCAWADYDNDGRLDLFVVRNRGSASCLFQNQGDGTFLDVAVAAGAANGGEGQGLAWGDYDNDGHIDLFVGNNDGQPSLLYRNQGNGTFVDVAASSGAVNTTGGSVTGNWIDTDNDGDLDLFIANYGTGNHLYRNNGNANHWLTLRLQGTVSNRDGIGATVTAVAAGHRQRRDAGLGGGRTAPLSPPLHFGLGAATVLDSLIVRWPSGTVQVLTGIAADQFLDVAEPGGGLPNLQITGKICFQTTRNGSFDIYSVDPDGSHLQRLTTAEAGEYQACWSPDGSMIAFTADHAGESRPDLYTMGVDGTGVRPVTTGHLSAGYPAWSPDGTRLAFEASMPTGYDAVYTINADGTGLAQLTNNPSGDRGPNWSPDGKRIAFWSMRDGNPEIYLMNPDGSGQTRLTSDSATDQLPDWSPDGTQILFGSERGGWYAPYSMRPDGSDPTLLDARPQNDYLARWSPEGGRLTYSSLRAGGREVYVTDLHGATETNLTGNTIYSDASSWAPFRRIGAAAPGTAVSRVMTIENSGTAILGVSGVTIDDVHFVATPSSFSVLPGATRAVTVTFNPDSIGVRYATLTIASNDPDLPVAKLVINGTGVAANRPPVLAAIGPRSVAAGDSLTMVLSATDADGDSLTYSVTAAPAGAVLSGATFNWTPSVAQVGVHTMAFTVADGRGGVDSDTVSITVTPAAAGHTQTVSLPGGATMALVWIPPGTFTMGDAANGPAHQVTLTKGYYLAKTELTQGQWQSVMSTSPWSGQSRVQANPNNPAVYVSWSDIQALVHVLNQAAGDSLYRLPTEAEWEYACRAGTTTTWSFGDDERQLGEYAWYSANAWDVGLHYAQAVGAKRPNPWGLFDMHGNVWEWVQDWFGTYAGGAVTDPSGPETGSNRVDRGGGFAYLADGTPSALRSYYTPGYGDEAYIGARLLLMTAPAHVNAVPKSDAGPDQSVTVGMTVQLDGSASADADGDSLTYSWASLGGIVLSDGASHHPAFTAPTTTGRHLFTLVVNDGALDSAPDTVAVTVTEPGPGSPRTQVLSLATGFNLVSWSVDTANDSIAAIVRPILPVLLQVSGFEAAALNPNPASGIGAKLYNPAKPAFVSTMKLADHRLAYWVKVSAPVDLSITGTAVPAGTTIPLSAGANLVSYLPSFTDSARHAVSSVQGRITQVTGFETTRLNPNPGSGPGAKLYSPSKPAFVSTMKYMVPGLGYWIKLAAGAVDSLVYPGTSVVGAAKALGVVAPMELQVAPTSQWMWLYGQVHTDAGPAPVGSLVEAIDGDGTVAGSVEVQEPGLYSALPVYLDDPESPVDEGAVKGEWLSVRVNGRLTSARFQWIEFDDLRQLDLTPGTTAALSADPTPRSSVLHPTHPNPFNGQTMVSYELAQEGIVSLVVYNLAGQPVRHLVDQFQSGGAYALIWNGLDDQGMPMATGLYLVRLRSGAEERTTRAMLVK
jgi:Tol biopolymer transport system component/formylglycine-generating enzyme required for sulfatase activity